jgi:hypothetical protein
VAEERPLLCVVDDAQWLDAASAQALAFVARRLGVESLGLVFAVREPAAEAHLDGLAELAVAGLDDADAQELLAAVITGPLDERVRDRIVAETGGSPLALTQLPKGLTPAQLAGGFALPDMLGMPGRIEDSLRGRYRSWRRRSRWATRPSCGGRPRRSGSTAARRRPRGPRGSSSSARRCASAPRSSAPRSTARRRSPTGAGHGALADATDRDADPDRRAWHRPHATAQPDEDVAQELERSAGRARRRGGLAFLQQATALTPDPARSAERGLDAARAMLEARAFDTAISLVSERGGAARPRGPAARRARRPRGGRLRRADAAPAVRDPRVPRRRPLAQDRAALHPARLPRQRSSCGTTAPGRRPASASSSSSATRARCRCSRSP